MICVKYNILICKYLLCLIILQKKSIGTLLMKVQFWSTSTVTAVETQGGPLGTAWTQQFRLMFSSNCVTFQPITDDLGNNKVILYIYKYVCCYIITSIYIYIICHIFDFVLLPSSVIITMLTFGHHYSNALQMLYFLQTFQGNFDGNTVVTNPLVTPVGALCLRLYPLTWNVYANVRLEVKGCPSV